MTYLQAAFPWVSGNDPWAGQVALLNVQPTDWYEPIFDYGSMDANLGLFALVHESGAYQFSASIYDSDRLSGFASMAPAAVTFYSSGSQVGGYINGANWAQPFDQSDITGTAFAIGGSPLQHGIWLSGGLGEVVLYSAALSAAEAHALAVNESEYFGFALAKPEPEQATCARNCNPA
jgi:hypothetical protein